MLFELCKKNYRGGQIDPPPRRNIVNQNLSLTLPGRKLDMEVCSED